MYERLSDDTLESVLEPLDSVVTVHLVALANLGCASSSSGDTGTWSGPAKIVSNHSPTKYSRKSGAWLRLYLPFATQQG